tara:strand:+ start:1200 stop:1403 length:204 start_codon:yes stop_codon:yes gene_type:complete
MRFIKLPNCNEKIEINKYLDRSQATHIMLVSKKLKLIPEDILLKICRFLPVKWKIGKSIIKIVNKSK